MNIDINEINIEKLRQDLVDYYMGIMFNVSQAAMIELEKVKNASFEEVVTIAVSLGFNLDNYIYGKTR